MSSWKGLSRQRQRFDDIDAVLIGISADTPQQLATFRQEHDLPFAMLSDPQLRSADALGIQTSSRKAYAGSLMLHPEIIKYPKKAFLQPAMLIWQRDGTLAHRWQHTEKLTNLYGARGRPSPDQIIEIVRGALR